MNIFNSPREACQYLENHMMNLENISVMVGENIDYLKSVSPYVYSLTAGICEALFYLNCYEDYKRSNSNEEVDFVRLKDIRNYVNRFQRKRVPDEVRHCALGLSRAQTTNIIVPVSSEGRICELAEVVAYFLPWFIDNVVDDGIKNMANKLNEILNKFIEIVNTVINW